ncbi:proton-conducting transporter membrane subunit [Candidatus Megaera polyxenophila]|uniref:proton-conducting transporter transmembrane domain-containing protein n=1 Tax=Candidatus Megaera polyxenophila TaxID=988779 RepID=UPI00249DE208|nr:proton-conducting transporter membrane subunit [Candidatus Megaera polyxenophila]
MMFFILLLLVINRHSTLFKFVALVSPIISSIGLFLGQGRYSFELYNLKLIWEFDDFNKLIGAAFLLVLLTANSYALGQKKYNELIIGCAYGAAVFISLLAQDFISMFAGLEIMMVMSSMIIFSGNKTGFISINYAKKYFLTHLVTSNMILIGIAHIMSTSNSSEIILVTNLMENPEYSHAILYVMFTAMVINIAAFPFSGWMVNYYKAASASGFLYLINFTTKLGLMLLIKVFYGFEPLKYIGLTMILYSGFKAIFEDNIFALLCYLSIVAMGMMAIGISSGNKSALIGVTCYLFIHIIYKCLLSVVCATLRDRKGITLCLELGKFKNTILLISASIGISLMTNIPFSLSFYNKAGLSHLFSGNFFYIAILLSGVFTIISFPWKEVINHKKVIPLEMNIYNKFSLIFISLACFVTGFLWVFTPVSNIFYPLYEINNYSYEVLKQLAIYGVSIIIVISLNITRKESTSLNILEIIGYGFAYLYHYWKKDNPPESPKENWRLDVLEEQLIKKLSILHNQQTAIFMVISLLIVMLATLLISLY